MPSKALGRLKISSWAYRIDFLIAVLALAAYPIIIFNLNDIKLLAVLTILPIGSSLYLVTELLTYSEPTEFSRITEDQLHISIFALIFVVALTAPSSPMYTAVFYYLGLAMLAGLIGVSVLFASHRLRLYLLEIVLLSILIRGAIFYQFPSVPGVDAVHTHAPTVSQTIREAVITSPNYYDSFPISHLRAVIGAIIIETGIKDSMYFFVYLPQAASVLFTYIFVRSIWGKQAGLIASLFVATTSFNILYGFRRFPQATTVSLLPVLLFTLSRSSPRDRILSVLFFTGILLAHNAPSWLLLMFLSLLVPIDYFSDLTSQQQTFLIGSALILAVFAVMKLEYIWISEYYNNIGRIINTLLSALGLHSAETIPTQATGANDYPFALLRFSSSHILISTILFFLFLRYIKTVIEGWIRGVKFSGETDLKSLLWYFPVAVLWGAAGFVIISDAPKNTKMFSVLGIIVSPLIHDFLVRFRGIGSRGIAVCVVFMLIFSISFVGVVHPRSNVSEFNRPGSIAVTHQELHSITFTERFENNAKVAIPSSMFGYWWLFSSDLQRVLYSSEVEPSYRLDNGEPPPLFTNDHKIYSAGPQSHIHLAMRRSGNVV